MQNHNKVKREKIEEERKGKKKKKKKKRKLHRTAKAQCRGRDL